MGVEGGVGVVRWVGWGDVVGSQAEGRGPRSGKLRAGGGRTRSPPSALVGPLSEREPPDNGIAAFSSAPRALTDCRQSRLEPSRRARKV